MVYIHVSLPKIYKKDIIAISKSKQACFFRLERTGAPSTADKGGPFVLAFYKLFNIHNFFLISSTPPSWEIPKISHATRGPRRESLGMSLDAVAGGDIYNRGHDRALITTSKNSPLNPPISPTGASSVFGALGTSSPHRDRGAVTGRPDHSRKMYNKFLSVSSPLAHSLLVYPPKYTLPQKNARWDPPDTSDALILFFPL